MLRVYHKILNQGTIVIPENGRRAGKPFIGRRAGLMRGIPQVCESRSSKTQAPNSKETPITKFQNARRVIECVKAKVSLEVRCGILEVRWVELQQNPHAKISFARSNKDIIADSAGAGLRNRTGKVSCYFRASDPRDSGARNNRAKENSGRRRAGNCHRSRVSGRGSLRERIWRSRCKHQGVD